MLAEEIKKEIMDGMLDEKLGNIYGTDTAVLKAKGARLIETIDAFEAQFGKGRDLYIFSAPGRAELGGNHTDHNNGTVLAAAVNLDVIAVVAKNEEPRVRVASKGFSTVDDVLLTDDDSPQKNEEGKSQSLLRGLAAKYMKGEASGLDIYTSSDVLKGSGLSSSAAFEICLSGIMNEIYGKGLTPMEMAQTAQYVENVYFGKPSGLMDQAACAVGGVAHIDFKAEPVLEKLEIDLDAHGYSLIVTDTKGDHADLTHEYAAIREEMEAVAAELGGKVLRDVSAETFYENLPKIRQKVGDRAVLRAVHFYEDCRRADEMAEALKKDDFNKYLELVLESGHSSFEYLQNAYAPSIPNRQDIAIGLAVSQKLLTGKGAWRLQGSGFGGTIQAYVPKADVEAFCSEMEKIFGENSCYILSIRNEGCIRLV